MSFQEIYCVVTDEESDFLSEIMHVHGALSIELQPLGADCDASDESESFPGWCLKALFSEDADCDQIIKRIVSNHPQFSSSQWDVRLLSDQNWVAMSQAQFEPLLINNRLWVYPQGTDCVCESDQLKLEINPGSAFGSGTHPTTQLCLQWLTQCPVEEKTVCDYGCGTGILTLAALRLGAAHVFATDIEQDALDATQINARLNSFNLGRDFDLSLVDEMAVGSIDVLLANILSVPLVELEPRFFDLLKPKGVCILSGLRVQEIPKVRAAYASRFIEQDYAIMGDWARLDFVRR